VVPYMSAWTGGSIGSEQESFVSNNDSTLFGCDLSLFDAVDNVLDVERGKRELKAGVLPHFFVRIYPLLVIFPFLLSCALGFPSLRPLNVSTGPAT
jgi:hypothetical protein